MACVLLCIVAASASNVPAAHDLRVEVLDSALDRARWRHGPSILLAWLGVVIACTDTLSIILSWAHRVSGTRANECVRSPTSLLRSRAPLTASQHLSLPAVGITEPLPRFSWRLGDAGRGVRQVAYRVQVTDLDTQTTMWDSGRVTSNDTNGVEYDGKTALQADGLYRVTVVW